MKNNVSFLSSIFCLAIFTLTGCGGGSDQPELGTVTGRITFGGKPLPNYIVNFKPVAGGRPSVGGTDQDGNYVLDYTLTEKGAKVGAHKVYLVFDENSGQTEMAAPGTEESNEDAGGKLPEDVRKLMKTFGNPDTTVLNADVKPGPNKFDFELKPK